MFKLYFSILETARHLRQKETSNGLEDDEEETLPAAYQTDAKFVEYEYDKLPPTTKLMIQIDGNVELQKLGYVTHIVFDVFGAVSNPLYSVRFNSPNEAQQHCIGKVVYYAPHLEDLTHTIFTDQLKSLKICDSCWDGEGECPDDELAFSDDEEEKRYMAKVRHNKHSKNWRRG
ncbi:unnamed protein product [Enterobius vermicularis]|uniref:H/ACA ribonucleoprotein complex subunit n=1 Tax=Enterobius vermicularis TaxID=51028 RepID=A0A3P6IK40_ENTVE|nr:unnamed protein product [Enterobius vermicularis]